MPKATSTVVSHRGRFVGAIEGKIEAIVKIPVQAINIATAATSEGRTGAILFVLEDVQRTR